ncbi:MAG: hypothetical protein Q9M28_09185 [Mariprofundaceae bacterium]|nr:hypothetical protein [Mariprofundaceae bacterium]
MIDFDNLKRQLATEVNVVPNSFVGISGKVFCLPIGMEEKEVNYENNKCDFFSLYKVLRKYTKKLSDCQKKNQSTADRDGAGNSPLKNTFMIEKEDGDEEVVYTRFSGIDGVLDGFDDLRLFALRERLCTTDDIDYSTIDRYLDKAIYLPDGTAHVDQMQLVKPRLAYHTTDLVRMYCYVYCDIKSELKEDDSISSEILAEAENFREHHLDPSDSLFNENYESTLEQLREQLERIDQQTAFKDDNYWHFYEALEALFYEQSRNAGDDGVHWGINNFCFVWEDMCQEKVAQDESFKVLYADRLGGVEDVGDWQKALTFHSPLGGICEIRPDAVVEVAEKILRSRIFIKNADIQGWLRLYVSSKNNLSEGDSDLFFCFYENNNVNLTDLQHKFGVKNGLFPKPTLKHSEDRKEYENIRTVESNNTVFYQEDTAGCCHSFLAKSLVFNACRVYDFKYKQESDEKDTCKQLVYEMAIRKNLKRGVQNVFVLPSNTDKEELKADGIWRVNWDISTVIALYAKRTKL